jgi:hypothetical protein
MLSILAKPKLAMQIESPPVDAIRGWLDQHAWVDSPLSFKNLSFKN